jgi:glucan 1,3-beta-glucosidase
MFVAAFLAQLLMYSQTILAVHIQSAIRNGLVATRGVNLGGWLVAEYWLSHSSDIWTGVDPDIAHMGEYHLMKALRSKNKNVDKVFKVHRDSWITEADIDEIARYGLNTVRVPVGWWIMEDGKVRILSMTEKIEAR